MGVLILKKKVFVGENGERPQIARRPRNVISVLYALCFDAHVIVLQFPVPDHTAITGTFFF